VRNLNSGASEVLVVIDKFNVTGDYLTSVEAREVDRIPCIEFALNPRGAALFGGLTGANLPDVATGRERQLAIILDGVVHSVPNLRQTITDRGQITGQYTYQEVRDLVAALRSGALPAPLKLVGERTP
jgi:preprotein translocase subunit SecD